MGGFKGIILKSMTGKYILEVLFDKVQCYENEKMVNPLWISTCTPIRSMVEILMTINLHRSYPKSLMILLLTSILQ